MKQSLSHGPGQGGEENAYVSPDLTESMVLAAVHLHAELSCKLPSLSTGGTDCNKHLAAAKPLAFTRHPWLVVFI